MSVTPTEPSPRFQFSVATLLLLTTVVAVALGLLGTDARQYVMWAIMHVSLSILPATYVIGALFGRGNLQVFCIGAVVPASPMLITGYYSFSSPIGDGSWFLAVVGFWTATLVASLTCGTAAVLAKRWIDRHPDVKLPFLDR